MTTNSLLLEHLVGDKLQSIWKCTAHEVFCAYPFMAPYQLQPGAILFVGINPSYTKADEGVRYYDAHQDRLHPYFKPLAELAAAVGQPWTHLDLLYYRETVQAELRNILKTDAGRDFIWQQLQLFPELLAAAQPSLVIVANADARKLLGVDYNPQTGHNEWLWPHFKWEDDQESKWDEELGTYRYNGIPFFFTSMLSGQRALDNGSKKRLEWHIRRALA